MTKPFHPNEFLGHILGSAAGDALAAAGATALAMPGEPILPYVGVGLVAGAAGSALGDIVGYLIDDTPATSHARLAALSAFVTSLASVAPTLLIAFLLILGYRNDLSRFLWGITLFGGFLAGTTGRLIGYLVARPAAARYAS